MSNDDSGAPLTSIAHGSRCSASRQPARRGRPACVADRDRRVDHLQVGGHFSLVRRHTRPAEPSSAAGTRSASSGTPSVCVPDTGCSLVLPAATGPARHRAVPALAPRAHQRKQLCTGRDACSRESRGRFGVEPAVERVLRLSHVDENRLQLRERRVTRTREPKSIPTRTTIRSRCGRHREPSGGPLRPNRRSQWIFPSSSPNIVKH